MARRLIAYRLMLAYYSAPRSVNYMEILQEFIAEQGGPIEKFSGREKVSSIVNIALSSGVRRELPSSNGSSSPDAFIIFGGAAILPRAMIPLSCFFFPAARQTKTGGPFLISSRYHGCPTRRDDCSPQNWRKYISRGRPEGK